MSRTDRHRPWRVQEADPYEQDFYWSAMGSRPLFGWVKMPLYRFGCPSSRCRCRFPGWRSTRDDRRHRRHDDQRRALAALKGNLSAWDDRLP
jgi:hypothetical protein